ncbi:ATP-binding protein [Ochrobactrum sp. SFR4]|uniref:ATP-binding protein n=1 Tax=Ochrobactrum sp. SFR4 TaxID=2717368 RepID=UPI001C8BB373|nr:ATP-binding protein [Ochrobactrum sp. SFR4]MBX8825273.1 ATP-binding protein [Ochrobactrum sp. SFR4]
MKKPNTTTARWHYLRSRDQRSRIFRIRSKSKSNSSINSTNIKNDAERKNTTPSHKIKVKDKVVIWQGGDFEDAISRRLPYTPPKDLCLENNNEETTRYLEALRILGNRTIRFKDKFVKRGKRGLPRIKGYTDFSKLERISTAAAVVLTAEYDRIAKFNNEIPPAVNLADWSDAVFLKLFQVGFFEVLGHAPPQKNVLLKDGDIQTMQIIRAKDNDELERVDRSLTELGKFLQIQDEVVIELNTVISEAISNMIHHAYPRDNSLSYPHLKSLWVSATANRKNNTLTVVAYDQGASIPITYPRIDRIAKVARYLERALRLEPKFEYQNDGTYIRAAMRYGGSRTDQSHRGKGLPQMLDVLKRIGSGRMKVYSRGGWCEKTPNGKFTSGSTACSIGGTLIEWSLELTADKTVVIV